MNQLSSSHTIVNLEQDVGVPLLHRNPHSTGLTKAAPIVQPVKGADES
ncbi:helix-turn-helix domain-containing protein [Caballeronia sp. 15711]